MNDDAEWPCRTKELPGCCCTTFQEVFLPRMPVGSKLQCRQLSCMTRLQQLGCPALYHSSDPSDPRTASTVVQPGNWSAQQGSKTAPGSCTTPIDYSRSLDLELQRRATCNLCHGMRPLVPADVYRLVTGSSSCVRSALREWWQEAARATPGCAADCSIHKQAQQLLEAKQQQQQRRHRQRACSCRCCSSFCGTAPPDWQQQEWHSSPSCDAYSCTCTKPVPESDGELQRVQLEVRKLHGQLRALEEMTTKQMLMRSPRRW